MFYQWLLLPLFCPYVPISYNVLVYFTHFCKMGLFTIKKDVKFKRIYKQIIMRHCTNYNGLKILHVFAFTLVNIKIMRIQLCIFVRNKDPKSVPTSTTNPPNQFRLNRGSLKALLSQQATIATTRWNILPKNKVKCEG